MAYSRGLCYTEEFFFVFFLIQNTVSSAVLRDWTLSHVHLERSFVCRLIGLTGELHSRMFPLKDQLSALKWSVPLKWSR